LNLTQERGKKMAGSCKQGIEPSGSIKCGEFLDCLRNYRLPKKKSAPWN